MITWLETVRGEMAHLFALLQREGKILVFLSWHCRPDTGEQLLRPWSSSMAVCGCYI